ncbi:hypothetical protein GGTG_12058 [Gaeumannomyces tritici R3-111a-1]|uniref:FAD-binding domain-containing protein n=1 Tax=Gaeumannomyces tritici (strain R3-111a-1) TaxID=644352 RepID=J3PEX9_GAET3|nr:hypothetical protein GGTG_12058 [Gaeumannomyces tritici R3-111a-1]EJT71037.1 hypothetical protein GGTG_12058 [Gaeumannomyces tritici R3-111a-1]
MGSSSTPTIAIVGAGPSGLTLAVLLHQQGLHPTVYELRQRPSDAELSQPTGMLDLHEESGLAAIRACGLADRFFPLTGECAECMLVADSNGDYLHTEEPGKGRPEISRNALTGLLLSALPADAVQWGTKVLGAARTNTSGTGTVLRFAREAGEIASSEFDLVVGADGAWSRVRPLLTDVRPKGVGFRYATLSIRDMAGRHPDLAEYIGPGTMMALGGPGLAIATQRTSQDSAWFFVIVPETAMTVTGSEENTSAATQTDVDIPFEPLALKARLLDSDSGSGAQNFSSWGPLLKKLIATACDEAAATTPGRPILLKAHAILPIGHAWAPQPGVTLIGDAAHLMMPVGEGVNMGMADALELSEAIAAATAMEPSAGFAEGLAPLLRDFETKMFGRTKEKAGESWETFQMMLGEDGAGKLAAMLKGFKEQAAAA